MSREQATLNRLVNVSSYDVRASQAQVDQTQAQLDARKRPFTAEDILIAASQVDQASAALEASKVQQGESLVRAPFKGVVAQKFVSPGAIVAPNTPVVQLVSKDVEIVLQVEEARIGQLRAGQPAQITVAAFPGQPVPAQVASVAPTADPRSRTFAVRILPNDPEGKLRDGMFAQVSVTAPPRATLARAESGAGNSFRTHRRVRGHRQPGSPARSHYRRLGWATNRDRAGPHWRCRRGDFGPGRAQRWQSGPGAECNTSSVGDPASRKLAKLARAAHSSFERATERPPCRCPGTTLSGRCDLLLSPVPGFPDDRPTAGTRCAPGTTAGPDFQRLSRVISASIEDGTTQPSANHRDGASSGRRPATVIPIVGRIRCQADWPRETELDMGR